MRRCSYMTYVITSLMSIALTIRVFQTLGSSTYSTKASKDAQMLMVDSSKRDLEAIVANRKLYADIVRKDGESFSASSNAAGFIVIPGNITVHVGNEPITEKFSYMLNAECLCSNLEHARHSLLVFVESNVVNHERRQAIRDTWGLRALQAVMNFRVVFILGEDVRCNVLKLKEESFRYGDLVQVNIPESFDNLGKKSVLGIQWSSEFCKQADFILKTDDDILIHISNLMEAIQLNKDPETMLLCRENKRQRILRKEFLDTVPQGLRKYEVTEAQLPGKFFPPYCSGMAYVFSKSVRDRLLSAARVTPVFFIEDAYLTGFVRYKAGVIITNNDGITLFPRLIGSQATCAFREGRIASQELNNTEMRQMWGELNTQGYFCPKLLGYARQVRKRLGLNKKLKKLHYDLDKSHRGVN